MADFILYALFVFVAKKKWADRDYLSPIGPFSFSERYMLRPDVYLATLYQDYVFASVAGRYVFTVFYGLLFCSEPLRGMERNAVVHLVFLRVSRSVTFQLQDNAIARGHLILTSPFALIQGIAGALKVTKRAGIARAISFPCLLIAIVLPLTFK